MSRTCRRSLLPARRLPVRGEDEEQANGHRPPSTRRRMAPPARGLTRIHRRGQSNGVLSCHSGRRSCGSPRGRARCTDPSVAEVFDDALELAQAVGDVAASCEPLAWHSASRDGHTPGGSARTRRHWRPFSVAKAPRFADQARAIVQTPAVVTARNSGPAASRTTASVSPEARAKLVLAAP